MNQQNKQPEKEHRWIPELPKEGHYYDLDQYKMLTKCKEKKDISEWNERRKNNPDEEIRLNKVNLINAELCSDYHNNKLGINLKNASLWGANFENSELFDANLQNATLVEAHLEGANLTGAILQGANFYLAYVDSSTIIWKPQINRYSNKEKFTDFSGVSLDVVQIDPSSKQLLEYNIRRKNWEEWYKEHQIQQWPIKWFWSLSDYGRSTGRIIGWFFGLALFFAAIYSNLAYWFPPGIISNFEIQAHLPLWHYFILLILRPVYFSVVTMTTLGFGDMYANPNSIFGHFFLTFQVILGYVLLGALVTRFAVLFTAGGPAGKFEDEGSQKQ